MKYVCLATPETATPEREATSAESNRSHHHLASGLHQARLRLLRQHRIARTKPQEAFEHYVLEKKISQK